MFTAKKRLLLAATLAEPGGVQAFLLGFAEWLKQRGHDVTVVAGNGEWLFRQCREQGIRAIQLRHLGREIRPLRDLRAYGELKRLFRELKPDAIHLNSSKMGLLGSLAARSLRSTYKLQATTYNLPRVVYRIGGWTFLEPLSPLHRRLYRTAERWSARYKDTIICVHPGDEELARQFGIKPRGHLVTIPNGIDAEVFDAALLPREEARQILSEATHHSPLTTHFIFGTVANFYPAKDLPRYLEACALVHKQHPEALFVILGDGMERRKIEQERERLGLRDVVLLPGAKENASALLSAFDAFVLPSNKEGMSWALLEAMAAGLPCIATDVGANRWMLNNDAGLVVPSQSPEELATAMLEVMRDPTRAKEHGARAREKILRQFPLTRTYEENEKTLI